MLTQCLEMKARGCCMHVFLVIQYLISVVLTTRKVRSKRCVLAPIVYIQQLLSIILICGIVFCLVISLITTLRGTVRAVRRYNPTFPRKYAHSWLTITYYTRLNFSPIKTRNKAKPVIFNNTSTPLHIYSLNWIIQSPNIAQIENISFKLPRLHSLYDGHKWSLQYGRQIKNWLQFS